MKTLLCAVPIFAGLSDKALEIFLNRAQQLTYAAGELIVREGEANHCMFVIESGEVVIVKNYGGPNPVTLTVLGPGQFFGEMCILETLPRTASGVAVKPTSVVRVSSSDFYHLYQQLPDQHSILLLNIARDLSRRLRHIDEIYAGGSALAANSVVGYFEKSFPFRSVGVVGFCNEETACASEEETPG